MRFAAMDTPRLTRRGGLLGEVGDEVSGTLDFDLRNQFFAQLRDALDQFVPSLDRVEAPVYIPRYWCTRK